MNKILPSILILTVAFYGVSSFAYADPNTDCDFLIRSTYENNVRTEYNYLATTENAQRCLADAGFYNYKDQFGKISFTGKYGPVTEQAAEAYLNRGTKTVDAEAAKKAEAAKAEADRVAEQERQNLQKKADDLKEQSQLDSQTNTTYSTSATNNIASSTQSLNTTNKSQIAVGGNTPIQDSREPASADKFLINSIYFLFALPFILFAISIIAAFLKVFKKPNE
jgi:23S rRNA pseudoU1915 N3-methylase RlmH